MRQKKFLLLGSFMLIVAAAGSYYAYTSNSAVEEADLLMANVEALADDEASTSWNCDAKSSSSCSASCLACKIDVSGTGALTGSHTCKK